MILSEKANYLRLLDVVGAEQSLVSPQLARLCAPGVLRSWQNSKAFASEVAPLQRVALGLNSGFLAPTSRVGEALNSELGKLNYAVFVRRIQDEGYVDLDGLLLRDFADDDAGSVLAHPDVIRPQGDARSTDEIRFASFMDIYQTHAELSGGHRSLFEDFNLLNPLQVVEALAKTPSVDAPVTDNAASLLATRSYAAWLGVMNYGEFLEPMDADTRYRFAQPLRAWLPEVVGLVRNDGGGWNGDVVQIPREALWPALEGEEGNVDATRDSFQAAWDVLCKVGLMFRGRDDDGTDEGISLGPKPIVPLELLIGQSINRDRPPNRPRASQQGQSSTSRL